MGQVVIASRLCDGLVVFLRGASDAGGVEWVLQLADAEVAASEERANTLLGMAEADANKNQSVIDIYLIDVEQQGDQLRPTKAREAIRCFGPTMRPDLGKQAEISAVGEN